MSEDLFENGPESTHIEQAFEELRSNDPNKRSSAIEILVATPLSIMAATPLPILLTALDDPNARVRKAATTALGLKGDETAIPRLLNLLQDKWVRETAVRALGQFGLPALLPILQGKDVVLRRVAVTTLGTIEDTTAIPSLLDALKDQDKTVRLAAAQALSVIGDASTAPVLLKALTDPEKQVSDAIEEALVKMGKPASDAVLLALNDEDSTTRMNASKILYHFRGQITLSELFDALHNKDKNVRREVVRTLGSRPRGKAAVISALVSVLDDEDPTVRLAAVNALSWIGDTSAIPKLVSVWRNDDQWVHEAATSALKILRNKTAVPILLDALDDERQIIRLDAVSILGVIAGETVVPKLVGLLHDADAKMRLTAAEALGRIGNAKALPGLLNALSDPTNEVRVAAAEALARIGNAKALPGLLKALSDPTSEVRIAATEALGRIGDAKALPGLLNTLSDPTWEVRLEVINILSIIGDASAIPGLLIVLSDPSPQVRLAVVKALSQFSDATVVPGLLEALQDKESYIRAEAAMTLGRIGDPRAIQGLAELLSDTKKIYEDFVSQLTSGSEIPEPRLVNEAAARALTQIGRIVDQKSVLFSAYYPKEVSPQIWYPLHLYCYDITAIEDVMADAQMQLSAHMDQYRQTSEQARGRISEGAMITATPSLEGFQFNPPSVTVGFFEDWHRLDFKLRASIEWREKASNGFVTFTVEGIIVADIPLSIYVSEQGLVTDTPSITRRPYQAVFCSYSHRDEQIVRRVEHVYKVLGMDYLRDVTTLKSGQFWNEELLAMIERADIFQLFWSTDSASSQPVEKEWRHALQLDREQSRFIRPVYWIRPMPPAPKELAHIHFSYDPELGT